MTMWSQITVIIPIVPTKLQVLECVFCFLLVFTATQGGTLYYSIVQLTEEATEAQLTEVIYMVTVAELSFGIGCMPSCPQPLTADWGALSSPRAPKIQSLWVQGIPGGLE